MADEIFPLRYKFKRKTTAQWASLNPVLLPGEPGIEVLSDGSEKIKYGDGVKTWSALSYAAGGGGGGPALSSAAPQALGATATAGTSADASRADHVHPRPTAAQVGADTSGTAASAVAAHEAANDPHPGYLTASEGNAAYATAAQGALAATAIQPGNPALTDARAPTSHKSSHSTGGSDALTPADIGAATAAQGAKADSAVQPAALNTKADLVNGLVPSSQLPSFSPGSTDVVPEGATNLYHTTQRAAAAAPVQSVAGKTGAVTLAKGDVGLGDVDNTSDANKPISNATQAALDGKVGTSDSRLSDSREWGADTISQAEAEAGTATTRRAFTALRVFQAIASWWNGSAAKTKLDGIASSATANSSDATLLNRANHTGTQLSSTISDLNTVLAGYQPVDSDLTALAALSTTSYGRAFLALADAAAGRTALGLGTLATQSGTFSGTSSGTNTGDQATNLTYDAASREVRSSTGDDATLPLVGTSDAGLQPATSFQSLTYAATVNLDLAALDRQYRSIALTGNLKLTNSNLAAGRMISLRLIPGASSHNLTFPIGWKFYSDKPTSIAASKEAVLSLTYYGTADTDCVAFYRQQP